MKRHVQQPGRHLHGIEQHKPYSVGECSVTHSDIRGKIGRPIAFYSGMVGILGGTNAAILFSQLFYWFPRAHDPRGVYKTMEQLRAETGLSRAAQETARKALKKCGVLVETRAPLEHKLFFRLDLKVLGELLKTAQASDDAEDADIPPNSQESQSGTLPPGIWAGASATSGAAAKSRLRIIGASTRESTNPTSDISRTKITAQITTATSAVLQESAENRAAAAVNVKRQPADPASVLISRLLELEAGRGKRLAIKHDDHLIALAWIDKRVTLQQLEVAHRLAVDARQRALDERETYVAFIDKFLVKAKTSGCARDASTGAAAWFDRPECVDTRATELGVRARSDGESWHHYRVIVAAASREADAVDAVLKDAQRFNAMELYRFAQKTFADALLLAGSNTRSTD